MKKWLMLLVALMLLVWACPPAGAAGPGEGFSDVARSAWYAVCVEDVRERVYARTGVLLEPEIRIL